MEHKNDLDRLNMAVFGTKPNHEDGMVGIVSLLSRQMNGTDQDPKGIAETVMNISERVTAHDITLYGTADNPVGIAKDVRTMKRVFFAFSILGTICMASLVVIEFMNKMIPVIKHVGK